MRIVTYIRILLQQIYFDKEKNYILDFMSQSPLKQILFFLFSIRDGFVLLSFCTFALL